MSFWGRAAACGCFALSLVVSLGASGARAQSFVNFESSPVRPLALSADGTKLFALNTPAGLLEIFDLQAGSPVYRASVAVGLDPVAIAVRNDSQVLVVNHLSDSVSIVDVTTDPPRVTRTLLVGDEPRDVVIAGPGRSIAFVSAAHRGQNNPNDPQLSTEGVGRADVWMFDLDNLGAGMGGDQLGILTFFGQEPRPLATDGDTVWVGIFSSGNQTTVLNEATVCNGGVSAGTCTVAGLSMPGGLPPPNQNAGGVTGPETGLIVRLNQLSGNWEDQLGRDWTNAVRFNLPDYDLFGIDATVFPPQPNGVRHSGVGTILMNSTINPVNGKIYVSNTEARNEVRFEGHGDVFGNDSVIGHSNESRITVIDGNQVLPRHLNKHIDFDIVPSPPGVANHSLSTPQEMVVSSDGTTLYVAAFSSRKVGIFDTAELEADTFVPDSSSHVELSGGGPAGLVLDEASSRLYVLTRFDNGISVIDTNSNTEIEHITFFNPEPQEILAGRPFLYDARISSSNGDAHCAHCHVGGNMDGLAWDLGDPDLEDILNNPLPLRIPILSGFEDFHPLKGPMTTQTLRGMNTHGSMHWRGDRTGGNDPGGDPFDEEAAFKKFNPAFVGLLGRSTELSEAQMQAFTDFVLTIMPPPNPIANLDNSLTPSQQAGRDLFFGRTTDTLFNCEGCHRLLPSAGFFGTDGFSTFENETQSFKVAQMRNLYEKVGMFGMSPAPGQVSGSFPNTGDQVDGFGFLHDGAIDTVFRFVGAGVFSLSNQEQRDMEAFSLAFPTNFAPITGQQITLGDSSALEVDARINLLIARSAQNECDLTVRGTIDGEDRGALRLANGNFQLDRASDVRSEGALRGLAQVPGQELTYTCATLGTGQRVALDRDEDTVFDRDEIDAGSDPLDPASTPGPTPSPTPSPTPTPPVTEAPIRASTLNLYDDATPPISLRKRRLKFKSVPKGPVPSGVSVPAWDSEGDPTIGGATLVVYEVDGTPDDVVTLSLPAAGWVRLGSGTSQGYKYTDRRADSGPIGKVKAHKGKLVVVGRGEGLYELSGAPHGTMGLRLRLGTGDEWCTEASAREPELRFDTTERFIGIKHSPAPSVCPPVPLPTPTPTPTPQPYGSATRAFLSATFDFFE